MVGISSPLFVKIHPVSHFFPRYLLMSLVKIEDEIKTLKAGLLALEKIYKSLYSFCQDSFQNPKERGLEQSLTTDCTLVNKPSDEPSSKPACNPPGNAKIRPLRQTVEKCYHKHSEFYINLITVVAAEEVEETRDATFERDSSLSLVVISHNTPLISNNVLPAVNLNQPARPFLDPVNNIAAGDSSSILEFLEQRIPARLSSVRFDVSTVSHRHDLLPDHPVNQQTSLANSQKSCASDTREFNLLVITSEDGGSPVMVCTSVCLVDLLVGSLMRAEQDLEPGELSTEPGTGCRSTSPIDTSSPFTYCCNVKTVGNLPVVAPLLPTLTPPAPTTLKHCSYAEAMNNQLISRNTSRQTDHHQNNSFFYGPHL
ncbi:hypothetical protein J6590_056029 [Homalodisca vitripennis]|nr:hypothetical protein J6590_056029 [Homalodisca vitripennis]